MILKESTHFHTALNKAERVQCQTLEGWLDKGARFQRAESRIENRESTAENRESKAESRESKTENRNSKIENRKPTQ